MDYRTYQFAETQKPLGFVMNFSGELMNNDLISGDDTGIGEMISRAAVIANNNEALANAVNAASPEVKSRIARYLSRKMRQPKPVMHQCGRGYIGFVNWLRNYHPEIVAHWNSSSRTPIEMVPTMRWGWRKTQGVSGMDDNLGAGIELPVIDTSKWKTSPATGTTGTSFFDPDKWKAVGTSLSQAGSALLPLYQQQQIMKLQLERAKQGLPPLDTSALTADTGMQVGINPATRNMLIGVAVLGVGGLLLYKLLSRGGGSRPSINL